MKMKISLCVIAIICAVCGFAYSACDLCVNKIGIGTTSPPSEKFHLLDADGQIYSNGSSLNLQRSTDISPITGFLFEIYKSRGSVGNETNVSSGDIIGQYDFYYHNEVPTLGARWGVQMDNSISATKLWFAVANRAEFLMNMKIEGDLKLDNSNITCIMMRDTDDAGWTECNTLNGSLTCSIDADGICDGS
jgi:hypothetical protein